MVCKSSGGLAPVNIDYPPVNGGHAPEKLCYVPVNMGHPPVNSGVASNS